MDRKEIAAILAAAGQRPQHQFGQNFMVDVKALHAIADAGEVGPEDVVLEVGPGVGNLTRLLAGKAAAVLAVDIDRKLLPAAKAHHAELTNVTWLLADVLAGKHEVNPEVLAALRGLRAGRGGGVKLVSNLPYNAASPLVAELLVEAWRGVGRAIGQKGNRAIGGADAGAETPTGGGEPLFFDRLAFTVQWEVGERMRAGPGSGDYGPLGILMQLMADVQVVRKIPPGAFWPPPKIHSALVVVVPRAERMAAVRDAVALQKLLAALFSHRRQKLSNGIKHTIGDAYTPELAGRIAAAGIDVGLRPESLTPGQFLVLTELVGSLQRSGS